MIEVFKRTKIKKKKRQRNSSCMIERRASLPNKCAIHRHFNKNLSSMFPAATVTGDIESSDIILPCDGSTE